MSALQQPKLVEGSSLPETWSRTVRLIRQSRTGAVANLVVHVAQPTQQVPESLQSHEEDIRRWASELQGVKPKRLPFTHGQRMLGWARGQKKTAQGGRFNQIGDFVVPMLVRNPRTKRALALISDPTLDDEMTDDPIPALVLVQFRLDDGLLHATAYFRAQEMYFFWVVNMFELMSLQEAVCAQVRERSVEMLPRPGSITTFAFSGYINPIDLERVDASDNSTLAIERFGISRMKPERLENLLESALVKANKRDVLELIGILSDDMRKLDRVRDIDYKGLKEWQFFLESHEQSLRPEFQGLPEMLQRALAEIVTLDMDLEREENLGALKMRIGSARDAMRQVVEALRNSVK